MIVRSASLCSTFLFGWSIVLLRHLFLTHGWTTPMSHRRCCWWCRTNIQRKTPSLLSIPPPLIQRRRITLLFDTVQQSNWKPDNSNVVTDTAGPNANHRRQFLWSTIVAPVTSTMVVGCSSPYVAAARGLVQFPCKVPLANTYNLMRVGISLLEEEGRIHYRNASRLSVAPSLCLQNR
jgi:hypothetical protein